MLLDDLTDRDVVDYSRPFVMPVGVGDPTGRSAALAAAAQPFGPALWMTVVSRGSFWPLHAEASKGRSYLQLAEPMTETLQRSEAEAERSIWTAPRNIAFELANVILAFRDLLLAIGYIAARRAGAKPLGDRTAMSLTGLFLRPAYFPHARTRRFEVIVLLLTTVAVSSAFLAADVVAILPPAAKVGPVWVAGTILFGLLTFLLLVLAVHELLADRLSKWRAIGGAVGGAAAIVGVVAAAGWSRLSALVAAGGQGGVRIERLMFLEERARNLDSGVSLLWMALLLAVAHALWILGHLRQVRIAEDADKLRQYGVIPRRSAGKDPDHSLLATMKLSGPICDVVDEAEGVWPSSPLVIALMVAVVADTLWIARKLVFFERPAFGWACAAAYGLLLALIVYGCGRYVRTWRALEEVLARVAPLPVTEALKRIPADLLTSFKRPWDRYVFEVWQRHCQRVFAKLPQDDGALQKLADRLGLRTKDVRELLSAPQDPHIDRLGEADAPAPAPQTESTEERDPWTRTWEEFSAMRLVAFVQYVRAHLANFIAVSTAALLPALWATNFYPLKENRFLLMLVLAVTVAAVTVPAVVFVQMNRNYVLSKMDGTDAGHVTWDSGFVMNLLVHVVLPLLALLAVKFPELGRGWSLLSSVLSASKGGDGS